MTTGEIEDLVACKAITSGAMDEVVEFNGNTIPDLR